MKQQKQFSPEEEIKRAGEARDVLNSRVFREASEAIRAGIDAQMRAAPISDGAMHTKLVLALQMWASLEGYLEQIVASGEMAQFKVAEEERQSMLKRAFAQFGRAA